MRQGRKNSFLMVLQENLAVIVAVSAVFIAGVIAGSLAVRALDENQIRDLNQIFFSFLDYLHVQKPLNQALILQRSLLQNGVFILLVWLCGQFFAGFLFVFGLVFYRGFTIGFTVGFLAQQNALQGVLFAIAAIVPQNLLYVPLTIAAAVLSVSLSLLFLQRRLRRQVRPFRFSSLQYTLVILAIGLFFAVGSLVEAAITPVFMRVVVSLF